MSKKKLEILRDKFLKYHLEYKNEEMLFEIIDKLQKENEDMREELQMYVDTDAMKLQEENKELKKEIDNLIKENHKHIDYIASMKKKQEGKIRDKLNHAKEVLENLDNERDIEAQQIVINYLTELLGDDKDE